MTTIYTEYTDSQRMELRSHVNLAGEVVARLWPMRTFISRNPLQGLEHLHFDEGIREGQRLFGGPGYLPPQYYQEALKAGRIGIQDVDDALHSLTEDKSVMLGARRLSHAETLRLMLLHDIHVPSDMRCDAMPPTGDPDRKAVDAESIQQITRGLNTALPPDWWEDSASAPLERTYGWTSRETLAAWSDRTFGTDLTGTINEHMIKWCSVFCDEGEAAWQMPRQNPTFFLAWKAAAQHDAGLACLGIPQAGEKIRALPDRPDDALLYALEASQIPKADWQQYLSLHIAAMPGWTGFIKWRDEQTAYPWQEAYRIDLVKYLAVRLFYERELMGVVCRRHLECEGTVTAIQQSAEQFPYAYWLRQARVLGELPQQACTEVARITRWWKRPNQPAWEELGRRWHADLAPIRRANVRTAQATLFLQLTTALSLGPDAILETSPGDLATLLRWMRSFPSHVQAGKWLEASELAHQREVIQKLGADRPGRPEVAVASRAPVRPLAQAAFCIDVRSEVFRRHLERRGGYETIGFAGFFGLPVAYRSLDYSHEQDLCPVLLKPKHLLREVPRTHHSAAAARRKISTQATQSVEALLHDLKHNVVTPYVMVEAIGWFFGWPLLGKTLFPSWYHRFSSWWTRQVIPTVSTTLTVDKLSRSEAGEMVAAEQRMRILRWLRQTHDIDGSTLTPDRLEAIRQQALGIEQPTAVAPGSLGDLLLITKPHEETSLDQLRRECQLSPRETAAHIDRITRTGFTESEQAYYIETSLRLMGCTSVFGRLFLLCGHGSTSQNNPYESALDCGACGGSHGLPNARAFATIANRPKVRELLAQRGIAIPADTHFVAAVHDTTTDSVQLADMEDAPPTHRKDVAQLIEDLAATQLLAAAERYGALTHGHGSASPQQALQAVTRRSLNWSQVRPEWGLARNSLFIVGSRQMTQRTDLGGRSFLHSYDHSSDPDGKLLEFIMTAPLVVAQWINMEYYFSTVAPDVYGSGSKIYHNVVGRIGVMTGAQSDLRMGLPVQTVLNGARPYHEPLRLTAIIEAPRARISAIINRQPLLEGFFNNRWLNLIACEPAEQRYFRYDGASGWNAVGPETAASEVQAVIEQV